MPFGLYNEVNDVDSARVPILLPQAVYPIINRNLLLAQTGAELYGYFDMGPGGGLEYRFYGGTLFADTPTLPAGTVLNKFEVPYLAGGRLMWETPVGLRLGSSLQMLRFNLNATVPGAAGAPATQLEEDVPFQLWMASLEYSIHNRLLAGEWGYWHADVDIRPQTSVTNQRWYVMTSYRVAPWFAPGAYYSSLLSDIHKPLTRDNYQHDFAASAVDINLTGWSSSRVITSTARPTSAALNGGVAPEMWRGNGFSLSQETASFRSPTSMRLKRSSLSVSAEPPPRRVVVASLVAPHARADSAGAYRLIVHPSNPAREIDRGFVAQAFLKKVIHWPSGVPIQPIDLDQLSPVRGLERRSVNRWVEAVKSYWQQMIFSGRGLPPPEVTNDEQVIDFVLHRAGAIGYVSADANLHGARGEPAYSVTRLAVVSPCGRCARARRAREIPRRRA